MKRTTIYVISVVSLLAIAVVALRLFSVDPSRPAIASAVLPAAVRPPAPPIRSNPQIVPQKTATPRQAEMDESAVGTPFTVSASVTEACKLDKTACAAVSQRLAQFAQQARDTAWADQAEADLQDHIGSRGMGKYLIRNIECRASLCVVEVASLFGKYLPMEDAEQARLGLISGNEAWAIEPDPAGVEITVTLTTYTRH